MTGVTDSVTGQPNELRGVLAPIQFMALLGRSVQGAAILRTYRMASADQVLSIEELAAKPETEPEARAAQALTVAVLTIAQDADLWAALKCDDGLLAPTIFLSGRSGTVAFVLHAETVEVMFGSPELASRIYLAAQQKVPQATLSLTVFDEDTVSAAVRFHGDTADIAARGADHLAWLNTEAARGREALLRTLLTPAPTQSSDAK